jgi:hypothetical protein
MQFTRDAYQVAENTPKERHYLDCPAIGRGAVIEDIVNENYCNCWVVSIAQKILDDKTLN